MQRLIRNNFFWVIGCIATIKLYLRRTLVLQQFYSAGPLPTSPNRGGHQLHSPCLSNTQKNKVSYLKRKSSKLPFRGWGFFLCVFVSLWFNTNAQRQDISLNNDWQTSLAGSNDPIAIE